jgi:hypothetical protein
MAGPAAPEAGAGQGGAWLIIGLAAIGAGIRFPGQAGKPTMTESFWMPAGLVKLLRGSEFDTNFWNRRVGAMIGGTGTRPPGTRKAPVLVRLGPEPGVTPSARPPVRIFLGTEPAQARAERVFIWSVRRVRDPARSYEIHLMKDLQGFDREGWKTGFTSYRYAIPALAGNQGRAIYNDVDQIYLADPAALFDTDMGGKALLSIDERETSVLLLDCEKLAPLWRLEEAQAAAGHSRYRQKVKAAGLWGTMERWWNSRDHEYDPHRSKLLHYTILHKQPWQPFPEQLRYQENELAEVWHRLEREADAAGFTVFTKEQPSQRYLELLQLYQQMHVEGRPEHGASPEETFDGHSLEEHIGSVARLIGKTGARTILDFGAGKGMFYQDSPDHPPGSRHKALPAWPGIAVTCYDPGYAPFAEPFEGKFDGVVSTDVLEHIPEEDVPWILDEMFRAARKFVFVIAACFPAKKNLPDGTNAHCTIQPPGWWRLQLEMAARRHPGIEWVLGTQEKSRLALAQRKGVLKPGVRHRLFEGRAAA